MKKRILMIADADGLWTRRYIENLLLPAGYQVVLFPIYASNGLHGDFYRENDVLVYQDRFTLPMIRHIPRLRMWVRIWLNGKVLQKCGPFHVIHNHYLSQRDLALGKRVLKAWPKARWICSFWGSDLLRISKRRLAQMRPYLRHCHGVTIHSAIQQEFVEKAYGQAIGEKTHLVYFGQTILGQIHKARQEMNKAACKAHFGIDPSCFVVCVGYNASPAQQQPAVLQALSQMPPALLKKMTVVVQMSYGQNDAAYEEAVRKAAQALACKTMIFTDFLDEEESAKLRICADIFILAILTDSFSASLQEYLYAGAQVLVGDWLYYPQIEELGITTVRFSAFEELPELLEKTLQGQMPPEEREKREQLGKRYSWEAVREGWLRLYE